MDLRDNKCTGTKRTYYLMKENYHFNVHFVLQFEITQLKFFYFDTRSRYTISKKRIKATTWNHQININVEPAVS